MSAVDVMRKLAFWAADTTCSMSETNERVSVRAAVAEAFEQIAEGKRQWDRVAAAIGANGDDVDDVFAKADAVSKLIKAAKVASFAMADAADSDFMGDSYHDAIASLRAALANIGAAP